MGSHSTPKFGEKLIQICTKVVSYLRPLVVAHLSFPTERLLTMSRRCLPYTKGHFPVSQRSRNPRLHQRLLRPFKVRFQLLLIRDNIQETDIKLSPSLRYPTRLCLTKATKRRILMTIKRITHLCHIKPLQPKSLRPLSNIARLKLIDKISTDVPLKGNRMIIRRRHLNEVLDLCTLLATIR